MLLCRDNGDAAADHTASGTLGGSRVAAVRRRDG
jgi:hypothetical protein